MRNPVKKILKDIVKYTEREEEARSKADDAKKKLLPHLSALFSKYAGRKAGVELRDDYDAFGGVDEVLVVPEKSGLGELIREACELYADVEVIRSDRPGKAASLLRDFDHPDRDPDMIWNPLSKLTVEISPANAAKTEWVIRPGIAVTDLKLPRGTPPGAFKAG